LITRKFGKEWVCDYQIFVESVAVNSAGHRRRIRFRPIQFEPVRPPGIGEPSITTLPKPRGTRNATDRPSDRRRDFHRDVAAIAKRHSSKQLPHKNRPIEVRGGFSLDRSQ
jgi:hypothetical protein